MADVYRDPGRTVAERVDDLLGRMTLDEKLAQLGGAWFSGLVTDGALDEEKLAASLAEGIGHVTRVSAESGRRPDRTAGFANQIQRFLRDRTRLGIPAIVHEEAAAGLCARDATQFPQAIGLASTWDPPLLEEVAGSCRRHMLAVGARVALSPVVDIARDPRWGRLEETYGEDPELASRMAVAYVRGLQGDDLTRGVAATAKHFLAYGAPDAGFNHGAVSIGPRRLRDVIAAPFRAAINEAGLAGVMAAYNEVDGLACSGSAQILTGLLRDELGFDGVVVADYWSVGLLESFHHVAASPAEAAEQALGAGLDIELPAFSCYRELRKPVEAGELDVSLVDRSVRRVLAQKFALGLFEKADVDEVAAPLAFDTDTDRALARRAAARSLVLLTNDGTLPLDPDALRVVAVLGPSADDRRLLLGDYHYPAHIEIMLETGEAAGDPETFGPAPDYVPMVTPLEALRAALPPTVEIIRAVGAPITGDADQAQLSEAVNAARQADVAVICVGGKSGLTSSATSGELRDAARLELAPGQRRLIAAVCETGTPTVVVVISGRAHALTAEADAANAILLAWLPGEEGGNAIAAALLGREAPAGRLPVSLLRTAGQVGVHSGYHRGGGRSQMYGLYVDESNEPLFPFGHGLTYTTFSYEDLDVTASSTDDPIQVAVTVRNAGERDADEVVQVYAHDKVSSVGQPERRLVAFARVPVPVSRSVRITFTVPAGRLGFTGVDGSYVVEAGEVTFLVGASWRDIRVARTGRLAGPDTHPDRNVLPPFSYRVEEVPQ